MEGVDIQSIVQGGAVGISVLLIFLLYTLVKAIVKIVGNHINHNTEIMAQLKGVIENNTAATEKNNKILDRVERALDVKQ